jgi:hypothetical protein
MTYVVWGYVIAFGTLGAYALSLIIRLRRR